MGQIFCYFFLFKTLGFSYFMFGNFLPELCENTKVKIYSNCIQCSVVSFPSIHFSQMLNFFYLGHLFLLVEPKARFDSLCTTSGGWGDYGWGLASLAEFWQIQDGPKLWEPQECKDHQKSRLCLCTYVYLCVCMFYMPWK